MDDPQIDANPVERCRQGSEAIERPVTVFEAQDQLLETALDLYRIMQRLHHQFEGLKVQYETLHEFYAARNPRKEPLTLEFKVAEQTDIAADQLQDLAEDLLKAARLTTTTMLRDRRRNRSEP